jgi:hypothetical protein
LRTQQPAPHEASYMILSYQYTIIIMFLLTCQNLRSFGQFLKVTWNTYRRNKYYICLQLHFFGSWPHVPFAGFWCLYKWSAVCKIWISFFSINCLCFTLGHVCLTHISPLPHNHIFVGYNL